MRRKYLAVWLILPIVIALSNHNSYADAREFSKSGTIYQTVKDGVVTVFSSTGHGSGFLVDSSGLIITNSHVVNEKSGHLRVKFAQNQVVEARLVENDRANDIAILAVNLKNIASKCPLPLFLPSSEPEALPGEKVLAIGTPTDRYRADQTLSEGVVGKLKDNIIFHTAAITSGSSGGPLLNFDGKVVGINSLSWNGLTGAISIVRAKPLIDLAQQKIKTIPEVSPLLLPDIPEIDYPIGEFARTKPELFENRYQYSYQIDSKYFTVEVLTPPQLFAQQIKTDKTVLKQRKSRSNKKGFDLSDDEYRSKNRTSYQDKPAVVYVYVLPNAKLTTVSKALLPVTLLTGPAATIIRTAVTSRLLALPFLYPQKEYLKDFLSLSLVDEEGKVLCLPIESGRQPFDKKTKSLTGYPFSLLDDKVYCGVYTFDSHVFATEKALRLVISSEGEESTTSVEIPKTLQNLVVKDFEPYWSYVKEHAANRAVINGN